MNRVLVIGPSFASEIISIRQPLQADTSYSARISRFNCGGSFLLAYDCAMLETDTCLFTRMAFDDIANQMMIDFEKTGGFLYSDNRLLKTTPLRTLLKDENGSLTVFDSLSYDAHPALEDGMPAFGLEAGDYVVANIINSAFLRRVLERCRPAGFIAEGFIPEEGLLKHFEGVLLEADWFEQLGRGERIREICQDLISRGLRWVSVDRRGQEIWLFSADGLQVLRKDDAGSYYEGAHEVYSAMLVSCLANGYSLKDAAAHGLNIANAITYETDMSLTEDMLR